mmetsp:Transcript_63544/g.100486  ORF Transcript_63544/g.100486 Transcript_63544/m.100486 type:complete len:383 (+) Transcript_63544:73-1221(+)
MLHKVVVGSLCLCCVGVSHNAALVIVLLLVQWGWPMYRMMATSYFFTACSLGVSIVYTWKPLPEKRERKWLILRGLCGALKILFQVLAVRSGTALGDIATFTSINMVFAAFLGRILLKEPLRCVHFVALLSSLAGATLIAKPAFLFGQAIDPDTAAAPSGYMFALAAGFVQAAIFICGRKSPGSSLMYHVLSAQSAACMMMLLASYTLLDDVTLTNFEDAPAEGVGWIALLYFCLIVSSSALSAGSKMCPAAVSAMVSTGANMTIGYAVQVFFFGVAPELSTLGGAALMFLGVVFMVIARAASSSPAIDETQAQEESTETAASSDNRTNDDETESLASFVSSEFAVWAPHEKAARKRNVTVSTDAPPAQRIGIVPTLMQTAV